MSEECRRNPVGDLADVATMLREDYGADETDVRTHDGNAWITLTFTESCPDQLSDAAGRLADTLVVLRDDFAERNEVLYVDGSISHSGSSTKLTVEVVVDE